MSHYLLNKAKVTKLDFSLLQGSKRGIERETLRVTASGTIASTNHPYKLGEKLTNPYITVDFSEGLLELITPPFAAMNECFDFLNATHTISAQALSKGEALWAGSMPPNVYEDEIKIAYFGHNNSAKMKEVYRHGLANRYGKTMQVIAGIHYNYSISENFLVQFKKNGETITELKNRLYFRLIRKFYDVFWLLPYLFGCSPICAKTSLNEKPDYLDEWDKDNYYGSYATSLRMSDLGYQSQAQDNLFISCNDIQSYVYDLIKATDTTYPEYEKIGVKDEQGDYLQLNTNILQIENEYYNSIRPKQIPKRCERPACALLNKGVEYVEIRLLDLDLFNEIGISKTCADFMEVFLQYCLLAPEKKHSKAKIAIDKRNFNKIVQKGRKPNITLEREDGNYDFTLWSTEILDDCMFIAEKMGEQYINAVSLQQEKINDVVKTPSAKLLIELKKNNIPYQTWVLNKSHEYTEKLKNMDIPFKLLNEIKTANLTSEEEFEKMESNKTNDFQSYINCYFSSASCPRPCEC